MLKKQIIILFLALYLPFTSFAQNPGMECLFSSEGEVNHIASYMFNTIGSSSPEKYNIYFSSPVQDSTGCWTARLVIEIPKADGNTETYYHDTGYNNMSTPAGDLPIKEFIRQNYYSNLVTPPTTPPPIELGLPVVTPQMKSELTMLFSVMWWGTVATGITAWSSGRIIKFIWHGGQQSW